MERDVEWLLLRSNEEASKLLSDQRRIAPPVERAWWRSMGSAPSTLTAGCGTQRRAHRSVWSTGCTRTKKCLIERANQYLKDRIEEFDDYYPCTKGGRDLGHVRNWLNLFIDIHYARRRHMRFGELARFLGGDTP